MRNQNLIVFTDLDGTLLDHHNYSWEPALPALETLRKLNIPVILCTSKTAAEVEKLHTELALDSPYIIENGAGIIIPGKTSAAADDAYFFGKPYDEILSFLQKIRSANQFNFTGFNDLSAAQVAQETGLSRSEALLAKRRLCSEPILWDDHPDRLSIFREQLARYQLKLLQGGRFYHVLDESADKGTALKRVLEHYHQSSPQTPWFSVALGDAPNDQDMLEAADLAVIIPSINGSTPNPKNNKILHATKNGPEGWNQAILNILNLTNTKGAHHG